jgi:hypothetical protein
VVAAEYMKMQWNENHADTQQRKTSLCAVWTEREREFKRRRNSKRIKLGFNAMPQHASSNKVQARSMT